MDPLCRRLAEQFVSLPADSHLWVGYSGGMDSHVLLHALVHLRESVPIQMCAVHVNHGLSPRATEWSEHCKQTCEALTIPFHSISVNVALAAGVSPEAAAREARYWAFSELVQAGDYLCTAHHQDDQAETVLLQLLRGAGPKGLAAMAAQAPFGAGTLLRPLLQTMRVELNAYAHKHMLRWIDDESNFDTDYDRNFLRHEIIPRLRERWPSLAKTIDRSARFCAEAATLLDDVAKQDLRTLQDDTETLIAIDGLKALTSERQKNVLRYWVRQRGFALPSDVKLQHVLSDVVNAGEDRQPCVQWPGAEVRRYGGYLYLMSPLPEFNADHVILWSDIEQPLVLPDGRRLTCTRLRPFSLDQDAQTVTVRFRLGGEQVRVAGLKHSLSLKKLLQALGLPPWQRGRVPLIYVGDTLVQIAGIPLRKPFLAAVEAAGFVVQVEDVSVSGNGSGSGNFPSTRG